MESGVERYKKKKKIIFIFSILITPFVAVSNPFCFFGALYFSDPYTSLEWLSEPVLKFVCAAFVIFGVLTFLKYPLFVYKRKRAGKTATTIQFYSMTVISQLPYLFFPRIYQEYRGTEAASRFFAQFILALLCLVLWLGVCFFYNMLIFAAPSDESEDR